MCPVNEIGNVGARSRDPILVPAILEMSVIEPRYAVDPELVAVRRENLICCVTVSWSTSEPEVEGDSIIADIVDTYRVGCAAGVITQLIFEVGGGVSGVGTETGSG